jgi:putative ABC transport system permease protein
MSPRAFIRGLYRLLWPNEADAALNDEVTHYLDLAAAEYERTGLPRDEAMRRARVDFGGVEAAKEGVRNAGWDATLESFRRDLAYGVRGLARAPGFTAIAVFTIALGIGVSTTMFSVVNAVLLRPLPYHDPNRLVLIWTDDVRRGLHEEPTAYRTIEDWRAGTRSFDDMAFFSTQRTPYTTNGISRGRTRTAFVSGNLFTLLGVAPLRGRAITAMDDSALGNVAVVSYSLWQRQFAGDSSAIGRTIRVEGGKDDSALQIVGVMPPGFYFPDKNTEIWTPATTYWRFRRESVERFPSWARRWTAVARLKPSVSLAGARADLSHTGSRLTELYKSDVPDFPGFSTNAVRVLDHVAGRDLQLALWVLLGAVGLVLLVACANVANLLLARGATRHREFALRRALGAGRARLVRQLIVESMTLAVAGGALGVALATLGVRALTLIAAQRVPRIEELSVDLRVLLFAVVSSLLAGLVFGVAPALRVSSADPADILKGGGDGFLGGVRLRRARGALVFAECTLAIMLLSGAGLLLRSLSRVISVVPGFDPVGVLSVRIEFPPEAAPSAEERTQASVIAPARAQARDSRASELLARVAAVPRVESVGFSDDMFIAGQGNKSITIPGRAADSSSSELNNGTASAGFFRTMRVPLIRGRFLTHDDVLTKIHALWTPVVTDMSLVDKERLAVPEPVVVNEAFARRFFPGEDPIGKRFCIDPTNKTYWYEIVGVVGDMHRSGLERGVIPEYFGPHLPSPNDRADLLVRTHGDPLAIASAVRQIVAATIPGTVVVTVTTADRQFGDFIAERNFQTWLLSIFAGLAVLLAAIGVYGVVHYSVAERTREIGVRLALGASPAALMRDVIAHGMSMPALGVAVGIALSLGSTRVMSHLLFEIGANDPLTFVGVFVILLSVAFIACVAPARRATRIDPVTALRA